MKNLREWLPSEQKEGSLWVRSTIPVSPCDGAPALILCCGLSCRCCRGSTPRARRRWHAAVSQWSGWMENGVKRMRNSSRQSWMLMLSPTSSSFSMRGPVSMLLPTRCAIYGSTQNSLNSISMLILWSLFSSDERGWLRKWRRLSECWAGFLGYSQHPRDERVTPQVEGRGVPQHWGLPLALQSGVHSLAWAYQGGITITTGSLPLTGTGPTELPWFLFIFFFTFSLYIADPRRSSADRRQGGVWEDLGGGALQRRLGPDVSTHIFGHAHAGRLLPHHSWIWGAAG